MKRAALTLIALAIAAPVLAKPVSTAALERQWMALNEECRGGNHLPEDAVCKRRDATERALKRKGRCWAYSDPNVFPFDYRWHYCRRTRP